ncbi:MAG: dicarboxylate/amino acid:cation symporter [Bacteroidales bacterium]|nr:dicarboxylate/amino acid:cation symporter [Bacteroidales bacterium]MDD4670103.1 dicarboxylate/amino acid:cation symporter [Bacteroidales bacterium]
MTQETSTDVKVEKKAKKKLALHWQILIGIGLGIIVGIVMCKIAPYEKWSPYIKWAGDMFLRGLRMIVIPLVFTSIALGVAGMGTSKSLGRIAGKTFAFYAGTTLIAATIGLLLVNTIRPGVGADLKLTENVTELAGTQISFIDQIVGIVPANIFEALTNGNLLSVIFFAIIFGFFITKVDDKYQTTLKDLFQSVYEVIMKITFFIIKLAPYGVFAVVANVVGKQAGDTQALLEIAGSLGIFVLVIWSGLLLQGGVVLPALVRVLGKVNPWRHIGKMSTSILTAFSTCSSGAALPINIRDSHEKCGVSMKIASFTLPLGCTINMNGTALYECVTAIFIAQVYGIDLSITQQIVIVLTSLLAAVGTAGIPMAGMVMLTIVLNVVGLPLEGIGLVLAVEQLCDMPRTMINSYGDSCGAVIVAHSEGEKLTI